METEEISHKEHIFFFANALIFLMSNKPKCKLFIIYVIDVDVEFSFVGPATYLMQTMESRPVVPDRKLLARLVLIREEARNMIGGGILDERNDRGLNTLPESEVHSFMCIII